MSHVKNMNESCHTYEGVMSHTTTHYGTLRHTATDCNTLQEIATHCNTWRHTATDCNTLQHTATDCNTLQHTATQSARRRGHGRQHDCLISRYNDSYVCHELIDSISHMYVTNSIRRIDSMSRMRHVSRYQTVMSHI